MFLKKSHPSKSSSHGLCSLLAGLCVGFGLDVMGSNPNTIHNSIQKGGKDKTGKRNGGMAEAGKRENAEKGTTS